MKFALFVLACLLASIYASPINNDALVSLTASTNGVQVDQIPVEIKPVKLEIKVVPKKNITELAYVSSTTTEAVKTEESEANKVDESPVEVETEINNKEKSSENEEKPSESKVGTLSTTDEKKSDSNDEKKSEEPLPTSTKKPIRSRGKARFSLDSPFGEVPKDVKTTTTTTTTSTTTTTPTGKPVEKTTENPSETVNVAASRLLHVAVKSIIEDAETPSEESAKEETEVTTGTPVRSASEESSVITIAVKSPAPVEGKQSESAKTEVTTGATVENESVNEKSSDKIAVKSRVAVEENQRNETAKTTGTPVQNKSASKKSSDKIAVKSLASAEEKQSDKTSKKEVTTGAPIESVSNESAKTEVTTGTPVQNESANAESVGKNAAKSLVAGEGNKSDESSKEEVTTGAPMGTESDESVKPEVTAVAPVKSESASGESVNKNAGKSLVEGERSKSDESSKEEVTTGAPIETESDESAKPEVTTVSPVKDESESGESVNKNAGKSRVEGEGSKSDESAKEEVTRGTPVKNKIEASTDKKSLENNKTGAKIEGRNKLLGVLADDEEKKLDKNSSPQTRKVPVYHKQLRPVVPTLEERPKSRYADIRIVKLESELAEDGKYRYNYESEDGTVVEQQGELKKMIVKNEDGEEEETQMGESVKGSYSYKDDEGKTYSITYTADENGYRPVGDHIPTVPPAIARALAWSATAKPWVDPWVVQQKKLREARRSKKLEEQKKTAQKAVDKDDDNEEDESH